MAVPNRKILARYFAELQKIEEHRSSALEKNIIKIYKEMLKELQQFLGVEYANFAKDDRLTYSALAKKNEYARFLEEVQKKVNSISPKVNDAITEAVKEMYKIAYEGMINAVANSVNDNDLAEKLRGIYLTQSQVVKAAVSNPVSRLTLSKTLEKHRKRIVYNIKQTVTVGIMNGDTMSSMANKIKNDVDQNYRKAMLIARTEVHRVRESGHNAAADSIDSALETAGSDYRMVKTWKSKQDIKVRHTDKANHVKLHGQTVLQHEDFDLGDGVKAPCPGQSGVAAHDCNCRCRISRDLLSDEEFFRLTGRHFPGNKKAAENVDKFEESGIIKLKGTMSNLDARKWYLAHDKTIPDLIDKSASIEEQARQACDLRNKFRTQARDLMADQELRKQLDIEDPNKSFEELVKDKMKRKNLTKEQAIEDILKTASKTRKSVNKALGLEE